MGWKDGHSSYAVDGDEDTHLRRCAILDNYYVDYPVWMVDLGDRKTVRGVVIITWQGRGEGIRLSFNLWSAVSPLGTLVRRNVFSFDYCATMCKY